jgi:putative molybdopterin biosynthesis protein
MTLHRIELEHHVSNFLSEATNLGYSAIEIEQVIHKNLQNLKSQLPDSIHQKKNTLRFIGSHDIAVEWLASRIKKIFPDLTITLNFKGSLGGLFALVNGSADLSGSHLWDAHSDTYNIPYIQKIFPGEKIALLTLSHRRLGWIVEQGNPMNITLLADITKPGVNFVNRLGGSETRVWLDARLTSLGIEKGHIYGYQNEKTTHLDVARAVAEGASNLGLGLETAALNYELSFIPLTMEKYDLVFRMSSIDASIVYSLQNWLLQKESKKEISSLGGYDTSETGSITWVE